MVRAHREHRPGVVPGDAVDHVGGQEGRIRLTEHRAGRLLPCGERIVRTKEHVVSAEAAYREVQAMRVVGERVAVEGRRVRARRLLRPAARGWLGRLGLAPPPVYTRQYHGQRPSPVGEAQAEVRPPVEGAAVQQASAGDRCLSRHPDAEREFKRCQPRSGQNLVGMHEDQRPQVLGSLEEGVEPLIGEFDPGHVGTDLYAGEA